jgi:DNA-binding response OmpR family regulator
MKYLQVSDVWLRQVLLEWLAQQAQPDFAISDGKADVVLWQNGADVVLSAEAHEVDRYAMPLRLAELVADIRWLMARRDEQVNSEILLSGDYVLTPHQFSVRCDDVAVALTGREIALLQYLKTAGESSREKLLSEVWRYHPDSDTHTVETHLWRLRQKLQQAGLTAPLIVTTDKGYRLA